MPVSKKRFEELEESRDHWKREYDWAFGLYREAVALCDRVGAGRDNALKDLGVAESQLRESRESEAELEGALETLEQLATDATELAERLAREKEELIAEGARLADELAAMRKAVKAGSPAIDGMRIEYDDGSSKVVAGCTRIEGPPYAPKGWVFAYAGDGLYLGQFATHGVRAIRPVLIESKATEKQPAPKKKAVATKKAGRK